MKHDYAFAFVLVIALSLVLIIIDYQGEVDALKNKVLYLNNRLASVKDTSHIDVINIDLDTAYYARDTIIVKFNKR